MINIYKDLKKWSLIALLASPVLSMGATRVQDLTEAKKRFTEGKEKYLAVFLHGSDWCVSGEKIKAQAWDQEALVKALPESMLLCAVDHHESFSMSQYRKDVKRALARAKPVDIKCSAPVSKEGITYVEQEDKSWLVKKGAPNPKNDVLSMEMSIEKETSFLRLTMLTDDSLPHRGPGRAKNGNFVITELEMTVDGKKLKLNAMASHESGDLTAGSAVDGDFAIQKNGWSVGAKHINHELYILPDKPIPSGAVVKITIHSLHSSKQHTLGRYKWDAFSKVPKGFPSNEIFSTMQQDLRNKSYKVASWNYPALVCLDKEGQVVGRKDALDIELSSSEIAKQLTEIIAKANEWNALVTKAADKKGDEKIALLAQAWILMRAAGASAYYKPLEKKISKLDPEKRSSWTCRVTSDYGAIAAEQKRLTEKDGKQAAVDYLDRMLADPRLSRLSSDQRQSLIMRKYKVYRFWKEQRDKQYDALQEMAKVDPTTILGIGANGILAAAGKTEISTRFGWTNPKFIPIGLNKIDVTLGVALNFYRPGWYKITFSTTSSKKPITMKSVSCVVKGKELVTDRHDSVMGKRGDVSVYHLNIPEGVKPKDMVLRLEIDAPEGHEHKCSGIYVQPYLPADGKFGWR